MFEKTKDKKSVAPERDILERVDDLSLDASEYLEDLIFKLADGVEDSVEKAADLAEKIGDKIGDSLLIHKLFVYLDRKGHGIWGEGRKSYCEKLALFFLKYSKPSSKV